MTDLSIPNSFTSGTSIVAADMNANFSAVETMVNTTGVPLVQDGTVTTPKLATGLAAQLGLTSEAAGSKRRGYTSVATEQTTTSTSYTEMTTPDEVTSVVVPTGGILRVRYLALGKLTGATGSAYASIFLGANQLKNATYDGVPTVMDSIALVNTNDNYSPIFTGATSTPGIFSRIESGTSDSSFVTTGMVAASASAAFSPIDIYVGAGTYDVSIRFKVTDGTLSLKERQLWVEVVGFS